MNPVKPLVLMGLLVILAGCAGATRIYYSDNSSYYYPEFVTYASSSGTMAVEIYGRPFGDAARDDPAILATALQMPPGWNEAIFTTTPKPERARQRLVLVFNPAQPSPGGAALCSKPQDVKLGPPAAEMRVDMALCDSADWVAEASLVGPRGSGPDDPVFRRTLGDGLMELMPGRNLNNLDGCTTPC